MLSQMIMKTLRIVTKELQRIKETNNKSLLQTQTLENTSQCTGIIHEHITGENLRNYSGMMWTSKQRKQNLNFCLGRAG